MTLRLPLQLLFDQLAQVDLTLDPATQLRVQTLLQQAGSDCLRDQDWEGLRLLIGPVIAKDQEELATFDAVFDERFLPAIQRAEKTEKIGETEISEKTERLDEVGQQVRKRRVALYVGAGLLAVVVLIVIGGWFRPKTVDNPPILSEKDDDSFLLSERKNQQEPSHKERTQQLHPATPHSEQSFHHMDPRYVFAFEPTAESDRFDVQHDISPYFPNIHPSVVDSTTWRLGEHGPFSVGEGFQAERPGLYEMEVSFPPADGDGDREALTQLVYLSDQALTTQDLHILAVKRQEAHRSAIKWGVFWGALFLILTVESYLTYFRQRRYRLAFRADFAKETAGTYRLNDPQQERQMRPEPAFYELAQRLNQRRASDQVQLDIRQTVHETIRSGGMPQLAYQTRSYPSEYLVLVEQRHQQDQQARLFLHLMRLLQQEDVMITVCTFQESPAICHRQSDGEAFSLNQLYRAYRRARLIIFSDGADWTNENTLADLDDWAEKALLTPRPMAGWGRQEERLAEHFLVLPTDLAAQLNLVEAFTRGEADTAAFLEQQRLAEQDSEPLANYDLESVHDLRAYLGDRMLQWLAATAVHPHMEWELTLRLGNALDERAKQRSFAESGQFVAEAHPVDLLTFGHLQKLSRLPWLQQGDMPAGVRRELLDQLDPALERLARQTVADYLAQPQPNETDAKRAQRQAQRLTHLARLSPEDKPLQRKLRLLWQEDLLDPGTKADLARQYPVQGLWQRIAPWVPNGRTVAVTCVFAFMGWVGTQVYQHQPEQLMGEYGAPFDEAVFADSTFSLSAIPGQVVGGAIGSFAVAHVFLEKDKPAIAREALQMIGSQSPSFDAWVNWYTTLTYVAEGDYVRARAALAEVDPKVSEAFAEKVYGLKQALDSPWAGR